MGIFCEYTVFLSRDLRCLTKIRFWFGKENQHGFCPHSNSFERKKFMDKHEKYCKIWQNIAKYLKHVIWKHRNDVIFARWNGVLLSRVETQSSLQDSNGHELGLVNPHFKTYPNDIVGSRLNFYPCKMIGRSTPITFPVLLIKKIAMYWQKITMFDHPKDAKFVKSYKNSDRLNRVYLLWWCFMIKYECTYIYIYGKK